MANKNKPLTDKQVQDIVDRCNQELKKAGITRALFVIPSNTAPSQVEQVIASAFVICPKALECQYLMCEHSKPHEPVSFGKDGTKNCRDNATECLTWRGLKCVPWEAVTGPDPRD